jgi:hypothetical protein
MKRKCDWPECRETTEQWFQDGWACCDALPPVLPDDCYLCPRHGDMYDDLACNKSVDGGVTIENGWSTGPNHSCAVIGYMAKSEKGEAFLTAYSRDGLKQDDEEDYVIGSGSLLPEELDRFKRMAAAAGVKLIDKTTGPKRQRHERGAH